MRNTGQELENLLEISLEIAKQSDKSMLAHFIKMALFELKEPENPKAALLHKIKRQFAYPDQFS